MIFPYTRLDEKETAEEKRFIKEVEELEDLHRQIKEPFRLAIKGNTYFSQSDYIGNSKFYLGEKNPFNVYIFTAIMESAKKFYLKLLKNRNDFCNFSFYRNENDIFVPENFELSPYKMCDFLPIYYILFNRSNFPSPTAGKDRIKYNVKYEVYQIDLTTAYLTEAKILGIIDATLYGKIKNSISMPEKKKAAKNAYLAAFGSLAAYTNIHEFNPDINDYNFIESKQPDFYPLQKRIVYNISRKMLYLSQLLNDDFLFFWVDAIFCKSLQGARKTTLRMKRLGFDSKITKYTYKVVREQNANIIKIESIGTGIAEEKAFYLPNNIELYR